MTTAKPQSSYRPPLQELNISICCVLFPTYFLRCEQRAVAGRGGYRPIELTSVGSVSLFFYQLRNLNHSSFGVRPSLCLLGGVGLFQGVCERVCLCERVGNWGFPVGLHTKHSRLLHGRPVSQVHTAGSNIRSCVFEVEK